MALMSRKPVEARRIGDTLVATFHRANPPLIWRFDLERNHSFTLALQGEEGEWELGLTSPKGEFHPIVRFSQRDDAEDSFDRIGQIMADEPKPFWHFFVKGIGLAFAVLFLVAAGFLVMVGRDMRAELGSRIAPAGFAPPVIAGTDPAAPRPIRSGVPQSADDVLTPP